MSELRKAFDAYLLCKDDAVWAGNNEEATAKAEVRIEKKWLDFERLLIDTASKAGSQR